MNDVEVAALHNAISSANGSADELRDVFQDAVNRFGLDHASVMWWSVFAANDATET